MAELECKILGPLEVLSDGRPVRIPRQQRAVLAYLALRLGETVPVDELVIELWGAEAPRTAKASLQNAVSGLRKELDASAIETSLAGYRLNVQAVRVDALRFQALVSAAQAAEPAERAGLLREALAYWRGAPLSELGIGWPEIARLDELHLTALEDRIEADLVLGTPEELVPELEALVRRHPLRERLWAQLMRALYLAGRQAEALAAYRTAHEAFSKNLGIEPGPGLKELQLAVLLQDRSLESGNHAPAEILARAAALLPTRTYAERAQFLLDHALALWRLGERSRARGVLQQAEVDAGRAGDAALTAQAQVGVAGHAWFRGEIRTSEYLLRTGAALSAVEATGNERVLAKVLAVHGGALREAGMAAEAAIALERAIEVAQSAADPWQEGWCRNHLAFTWVLGPMPAAETLRRCEEQLDALEWGPPGPIGLWAAMGVLHSHLGSADRARKFGTFAVDGAREAGLRFELAWAREWLATALEPFYPDESQTQLGRAHDLLAAHEQDAMDLASVDSEIARHAIRRNALEEADRLLAAARERLRGDIIHEQVVFHHAAALLEERRGNTSRAIELARRAVGFGRKADNIHRLAVVLETLARLDPRSRALEEAARLYKQKGDVLALARIRADAAPPES